ncbi:MAG TPA: cytochrome c biogenesis protein DipZ [Solirubrobacteraceae bacterium]|nr:cytochrome c biogenesis protein DipZ [Solirubrobacteraceae bacterium]
MALLVLFALLAGAGTAVSPCVLPVLPALLSAGATGGRRRPIGIVLGLAATFTITIVGLAKVIDGVGLGHSATRDIAIGVLALFGVIVAVPALAARVEAPLSRLQRLGPQRTGDGFPSGLAVGAALGFVYAPCAGPILAAVISVSAASGRTVAVGLAYSLGSALVLLALALGGRAVLEPVRRAGRGAALQAALGAVMVLTAVAMSFQLDVRFETAIASHLPSAIVDPTHGLESSSAVTSRLLALRSHKPMFTPVETAAAATPAGPRLPKLGAAPDFTGTQRWFNTPGGRPLTLRRLRGRVVLVDFWTYTCINCIRTLPYLKAWDARYRAEGLTIVGVHSPEFDFEKDAGNVQAAIRQNGLRYPVVQDNDLKTWAAWGNQYWPADYLIDATGQVRAAHFGEGDYAQTEAEIRELLRAAGRRELGGDARPRGVVHPTLEATPETYLGLARAERFLPGPSQPGTHDYPGYRHELPLSHFALSGTWRLTDEAATAVSGAGLEAEVGAKDVYLVLSPPSPTRHDAVTVTLDGRPLRTLDIDAQRLYHLVHEPRFGIHRLRLRFSPGVSGYAFTFG